MPRVHDNVAGRSLFIRADANGKGFISALNISTAAIYKNQPVQLGMNKDGYTIYPSTYAAGTDVRIQWMGIAIADYTASQGNVAEVQVVGPAKLVSTVAFTTDGYGCIQRTTAAYVDAASATYTGVVGQWAMMRTITTAVTTEPQDVLLLGRPILRNGTTIAF